MTALLTLLPYAENLIVHGYRTEKKGRLWASSSLLAVSESNHLYYNNMLVNCTVLCKSNANVLRRNLRLFLAFRRKNIEFSMEANFQRKVTIIQGAYCSLLCEFLNDNSFGTKSDFEFSSEKALCSMNDFEHMSEISLFISSAQTFPTICQVRSCRDDSFVLSSP